MRPLLAVLLISACMPHGLPPPEAPLGPRSRTEVVTRDGVALFTKVRLPGGDGPFPTVLVRAPYPMDPFLDWKCRVFNRHGYACVYQDTRGRGRSEGEWLPFEHEPDDGRDALAWIAAQPWCDGNIAMLGESYLGATAWAVLDDPPPELKTIVPTVIGLDLYGASYEGGMFRHDILTAWMSMMPGHEFRYTSGSRGYQRALDTRPRMEMDLAAAKREIPWFRAWMSAEDRDDPFWQRPIVQRGAAIPETNTLPVLMMAGWADAFLGPEVATYERLATRDRSTLVIGPWDHLTRVAADVRQRGLDDEIGLADNYLQWERVLDWLGHHLRGRELRYPAGGVASYAVNGGAWSWYETWPPPSAPQVFALSPGDDPQACTGVLAPEGLPGTVEWTYDPADPTPSRGGAGVLAGAFPLWKGSEPGFIDQGKVCERRDDLVGFLSSPLDAPLHVVGSLEATLVVASDAPDTAFNVRFLEERANGARIFVRESILALSHRPDAAPYVPGSDVTIALRTWPVDYVFEPGSRLLVEVASASFPKYEAHSNTTEPWALATETPVAHQRLVLTGSHVTLPVLAPPPEAAN